MLNLCGITWDGTLTTIVPFMSTVTGSSTPDLEEKSGGIQVYSSHLISPLALDESCKADWFRQMPVVDRICCILWFVRLCPVPKVCLSQKL